MNYTFALALITGATQAYQNSYYPLYAPQGQTHGAHPTHGTGNERFQHGHGGRGGVFDTYKQSYQPNQWGTGYGYDAEPEGYYHQKEEKSFSHPNIWGTNGGDGVDRTTWWSTYQQYRPPIVPYVPANIDEPCYAICQMIDDTGAPGTYLQFAQRPGRPVEVQGKINDEDGCASDGAGGFACAADIIYDFPIKETGVLDGVGGTCTNAIATAEWNPQQGLDKYGELYTFQDPARGRVPEVSVSDRDTTATFPSPFGFVTGEFFGQLAGLDSVIGRAMTMRTRDPAEGSTGTSDDPFVWTPTTYCCVIVQDAKPTIREHQHTSYPYPRAQPQHQHQATTQYAAPKTNYYSKAAHPSM